MLKETKAFQAVFALMSNQKQSTYIMFLQKLKDLYPNMNPQIALTVFEKALQIVFPEVKIKKQGLFFFIFNNPYIERFAKWVLTQRTHTENDPGIVEKVLEYFNEVIERL
jgi:hypothetical protein